MLDFSLQYLNLLKTKYAGLNLTRILDSDEFYNKQILDSIIPYNESKHFKDWVDKSEIIIDIGFGGGFPVLPLAKLLPHKKFLGFEARGKKVQAVSDIAQELGLSNVQLFHQRIEDLEIDKDVLFTFKAVGTIQDFLPMINFTKSAKVIFYKGPSYEIDERVFLKKIENWQEKFVDEIKLSGIDKRIVVGFESTNVPRRTSTKKLVKLSSFL